MPTLPLVVIFAALTLSACSQREIHPSNDFPNNGRDEQAQKRDSLYLQERLPPALPYPEPEFFTGIEQNQRYLARITPAEYVFEQLQVTTADLQVVNKEVATWLQHPTYSPKLRAHQLAGQDQRGNVQITGYYVPILPVRHQADAEYKYPLYKRPPKTAGEPLPTREQIDFEGALDGMGLELAYTNSLIDNFFLHVQGSGVVEYEDGQQRLLSWGGVNGHGYRSIGKELIERGEIAPEDMSAQAIKDWLAANPQRHREIMSTNPSYLFFSEGPNQPVGAANVALTPGYSVAVDPSVIPLGSVLLGELPRLNGQGELVGHEWRLLLAQDKGGAIKGPGHIDWYQGIGEEAHFHASQLKHYGRVWLLLPDQR
ncbi:murein transglycosylase A [Maribrevibacterium harenarium]|uniref:peptidoglycan lytic exotransglycosylase n=1 Tax=Maribrevibacterium harenarium TaxID=2589817 RepID=A0A501WWH9_9GAMM|nr:murein transglycosylase A [Maribrevibacterium harenarium]TPE54073.1 murein transglycosylase A [Maribrevibacterium harenarium]